MKNTIVLSFKDRVVIWTDDHNNRFTDSRVGIRNVPLDQKHIFDTLNALRLIHNNGHNIMKFYCDEHDLSKWWYHESKFDTKAVEYFLKG